MYMQSISSICSTWN